MGAEERRGALVITTIMIAVWALLEDLVVLLRKFMGVGIIVRGGVVVVVVVVVVAVVVVDSHQN